jgi:predicted dithiol-disulfide oxidoreductase (DUF899 family)
MTDHRIGTQEEWQAERDELLAKEKELTRLNDELAERRRGLPWVPVEKGLSLRHRARNEVARRALRGALAAAPLPLHVRALI